MSHMQYDNIIVYDFDSLCMDTQDSKSVIQEKSLFIQNDAGKKIYRNSWKIEEDELLIQGIQRYGCDWKKISQLFNNNIIQRESKACKERYQNSLCPMVNKRDWSKEEENQLFQLQYLLGNKWRDIAKQLPNRTDQIVKNYFHATVRRVLRRLLKAAGNKNCSQLCRDIKPCVLSRIFSLNKKEDRIVLDPQFTQLFRGLIFKYRNLSFSEFVSISPEDQEKITYIFENLTLINLKYKDEKQALQLQKCQKFKQQVQISVKDIRKKQESKQAIIDEILLEKIVKKKAIFKSTVLPKEKRYKQVLIAAPQVPQYLIQDQCLQIYQI